MKPTNALLLCLGFLPFATAEAAEPGWYFVGFGGESSASGLSVSEAEDRLAALFDSAGLDVVDSTTTIDDSDTGFGLAGGYQVNDHFALEVTYVDLGSVGSRHAVTATDGVETSDADVVLQSSADGAALSALGILPIGERFSVFARVGISFLSADGTARITVDGQTQRPSQSSQKTDPVFGVGAEYNLSKHFAVRLAWDRYTDIGTDDVTGSIDGDLISLGIRMGAGWFR